MYNNKLIIIITLTVFTILVVLMALNSVTNVRVKLAYTQGCYDAYDPVGMRMYEDCEQLANKYMRR